MSTLQIGNTAPVTGQHGPIVYCQSKSSANTNPTSCTPHTTMSPAKVSPSSPSTDVEMTLNYTEQDDKQSNVSADSGCESEMVSSNASSILKAATSCPEVQPSNNQDDQDQSGSKSKSRRKYYMYGNLKLVKPIKDIPKRFMNLLAATSAERARCEGEPIILANHPHLVAVEDAANAGLVDISHCYGSGPFDGQGHVDNKPSTNTPAPAGTPVQYVDPSLLAASNACNSSYPAMYLASPASNFPPPPLLPNSASSANANATSATPFYTGYQPPGNQSQMQSQMVSGTVYYRYT